MAVTSWWELSARSIFSANCTKARTLPKGFGKCAATVNIVPDPTVQSGLVDHHEEVEPGCVYGGAFYAKP
jgi:hypothetical protein